MNLRESVEQAAETIKQDQLCSSEAHCLLTEALKCPDIILAEGIMDAGCLHRKSISQHEDCGIEIVDNLPVLL